MKWYFRILIILAVAISVVAIFIDTNVWDYVYVLVQSGWELIVWLLFLGLFKRSYDLGQLEISKTEYKGTMIGFCALICSSLVNIGHGISLYFKKAGVGHLKCAYYESLWLPYWNSMFWYWLIYAILFLIFFTFLWIRVFE